MGLLSLPGMQHPYAYALNNPLRYTDPSGEFVGALLGGLAIGMVAGGVSYALRHGGQPHSQEKILGTPHSHIQHPGPILQRLRQMVRLDPLRALQIRRRRFAHRARHLQNPVIRSRAQMHLAHRGAHQGLRVLA